MSTLWRLSADRIPLGPTIHVLALAALILGSVQRSCEIAWGSLSDRVQRATIGAVRLVHLHATATTVNFNDPG